MFWADATSNVPGFEDLLREAARRPETDPGTALVEVLKGYRVPGLNLDRVLSSVDPRNRPANLLPFLARIASDGAWGVNLRIRVD
jgi:hypothetical protein